LGWSPIDRPGVEVAGPSRVLWMPKHFTRLEMRHISPECVVRRTLGKHLGYIAGRVIARERIMTRLYIFDVMDLDWWVRKVDVK
jgi:hypothetical protein